MRIRLIITINLYTDASGVHGWGAYWDGRWIQSLQSLSQRDMDITWKEMYVIVLAVHTWGYSWARQKILFHCDNQAVVEIWDRGCTCAPHTMGLVHLLYFCASRCDINVCATHVSGVHNDIADSLSRFQMEKFRKLAPRSMKYPDRILAWPTQSFMSAFCNPGIMELPSPQDGHINQNSKNSKRSVTNMVSPSSLTLQYFCAHESLSVSHKTIKVYLAAIHLHHIEHNLLDPTADDLLHLVCRGIRRLQGDTQRTRLPITINLMHTQLRQSTYTIYEQQMLWAAFTMKFYGFLRVSKLTSLKWSDISISADHVSVTLHQSKTDPFRCGCTIRIYYTKSSTCPYHALD